MEGPLTQVTSGPSLILPSQIIPFEVECIRNMEHAFSRVVIVLNKYDVETAGTIPNTMLHEILGGQLNQLGAFSPVNCLHRAPKRLRASPFDFHEYQDASIIGNKVQFAQRGTYFAAQNSKTALSKVRLRISLSLIAYYTTLVAHRRVSAVLHAVSSRLIVGGPIARQEMLNGSKGTAVNRTGSVLPKQAKMLGGAIPLMLGKFVLRVPAVILDH